MKVLLMVAVMVAGGLTAVQAGMNAQLRHSFGHGILGALTNFLIGSAALLTLVVVARVPFPSWATIGEVPRWAWLGGLCGAALVTSITVAARELGALYIAALLLVGQLAMSVVLDHYGWFGFPVRPFTYAKLAGGVLLVVALVLFKES